MANHKIEIRRRNIEKILQAAEKVFAEKGYGATSMGDIAEQAELHLQVGLLAEQEATKMLEMLRAIHDRLGLAATARDPELREMIRTTQVEVLADELKRAREADEAAGDGAG